MRAHHLQLWQCPDFAWAPLLQDLIPSILNQPSVKSLKCSKHREMANSLHLRRSGRSRIGKCRTTHRRFVQEFRTFLQPWDSIGRMGAEHNIGSWKYAQRLFFAICLHIIKPTPLKCTTLNFERSSY